MAAKTLNTIAKPSSAIRIASFNVHFAKRPQKVAEAIMENKNLQQADLIFLQEIEHHEKEIQTRAEIIAHLLGHQAYYEPARKLRRNGTHGLAILSRWPLQNLEVIKMPFFNLLFRSRERIALHAELQLKGHTISLYNLHLDTMLNIADRISQLTAVIEHYRNKPIKHIILAGDLNTIPIYWLRRGLPLFYSRQKKQLQEFLLKENFVTFPKSHYTMRLGLVQFYLDAIFVKNLELEDFGVEKRIRVSDHKPLWADVMIK